MSARLDLESAVTPLGGGRYRATFSTDWWVHAGPNGGIVAATVLRACSAEVGGDAGTGAARWPRTLTVHYLAPPQAGDAEVTVTVERAGRGVTFLSARLAQGGRAVAVGLAAFSTARDAFDFGVVPLPELPPPEACTPLIEADEGPEVTIRHRWDCRIGLGALPTVAPAAATSPPSPGGAARAVSGGWIRLAEPCSLDHHVVAAMADGWMPPIFTLPGPPAVGVPTLELTVHFRDTEQLATLAPDSWFACAFTSNLSQEGFVEEDGVLWGPGGRVVAMSRQLSVVAPREPLGPDTRSAT